MEGNVQELDAGVMYAGAPAVPLADSTTAGGVGGGNAPSASTAGTAGAAAATTTNEKAKPKAPPRAKVVCYKDWTLGMTRATCVLAGCDFLPSLLGIQYKTAHTIVAPLLAAKTQLQVQRQQEEEEGNSTVVSGITEGVFNPMEAALAVLKEHRRWRDIITDEYCDQARLAYLTFSHAVVYDPRCAACVRLTPVTESVEGFGGRDGAGELSDVAKEHMGRELEDELARGIAQGEGQYCNVTYVCVVVYLVVVQG
jgi:hypothetical protein